MWIEISKLIFDVFSKKKESNQNSKERLSVVFHEISELLRDTAHKIQEDIYPHGNCVAMDLLSKELSTFMFDKIDNERLSTLTRQLEEASRLELEYAKRKDPSTIIELEQASGLFKGLSILYKI